jgi:hypothetical protein
MSDEILKRRFDPNLPLEFDVHRCMPASSFNDHHTPESLQEIDSFRQIACTFHHDISNKLTDAFTTMGFREQWLALDQTTQEERLREAFRTEFSICGSTNSFVTDPAKLECPELITDQLLRNGGRGVLTLAEKFLLEDNDKIPTVPFTLTNKRFDEWIGYKGDDKDKWRKVTLELRRGMRTVYIGMFLLFSVQGEA